MLIIFYYINIAPVKRTLNLLRMNFSFEFLNFCKFKSSHLWGAGIVSALLWACRFDLTRIEMKRTISHHCDCDHDFDFDHNYNCDRDIDCWWLPRERSPNLKVAWRRPCPGRESGSPPAHCGT